MTFYFQEIIINFTKSVISSLSAITTNITSGVFRSEPLGVPSVGRTVSVTTTQAGQPLTANCRRVSLVAVGCAMRFRVGVSSAAPTASDHLIQQGERIDIAIPASETPWINVVRDAAATTNGTLNISELVNP